MKDVSEKLSKPKPVIPKQHVVITDINMPFMSMVNLMVKFALASIPAAIAIYFLIAMFGGVIVSLLGK